MLIINYPTWVKDYRVSNGEYPSEYYQDAKEQNESSIPTMDNMRQAALDHPNYLMYNESINGSMREYEHAHIVGISKSRENFDYLYETYAEDNFNGGFVETKIGEDYIMYGFSHD
jgi:hypothetical protein